MIFLKILLLIVGMVFLIKGADWFVDGSSKIAKALKISPLIIGLTLVSIGTSLPELSVSITSALQGKNDMSFGNVLGSNIFNVFVVIGASCLFTSMFVSKTVFKYDIPILIFIYLLLFLFGFVITPNILSTWESIVLVLMFVLYICFLILRSKKFADEKVEVNKDENIGKWYLNLLLVIVGIAGIVIGGQLVVDSASYIAESLGMSELLVGLTIVAVGTSLPELVTSIVAARKKENDIAVGNAIGSCIFNILLILGLSSSIKNIAIDLYSIVDMIFMLLSVILVFCFSIKDYKIGKIAGLIMIILYIIYLIYIILRNIYPEIFMFSFYFDVVFIL